MVHEPHRVDALAVTHPDAVVQLVPREADLWQVDADLDAAAGPRRPLGEGLSHAHAFLDGIAEPLVEPGHRTVLALDLQVDLRTAELTQQAFRLAHECAPDALSLVLGRDGDAIEPPAVAVVAGQCGADEGAVPDGDQEQLALPPGAPREDRLRRTPARVILEDAAPERGDRLGVSRLELADVERRHHVTRYSARNGSDSYRLTKAPGAKRPASASTANRGQRASSSSSTIRACNRAAAAPMQ